MIRIVKTNDYYYYKGEPILVNQVSIRETDQTYMFVNFEPDGRWFDHKDLTPMESSNKSRFQSQLTFRLRKREYLEIYPNDIILIERDKKPMYYKFLHQHSAGEGLCFQNLDTKEIEIFERTYPFRLFHTITQKAQ